MMALAVSSTVIAVLLASESSLGGGTIFGIETLVGAGVDAPVVVDAVVAEVVDVVVDEVVDGVVVVLVDDGVF